MPERIARTWLLIAAALLLFSTIEGASRKPLTDLFLTTQDLPALLAIAAAAAAGWSFLALRRRFAPAAPSVMATSVHLAEPDAAGGWRFVLGLSTIVGLTGLVGARGVFDGYPLSLDEFMATFDAAIFRHGDLLAPVAPAWRPFVPALQPQFLRAGPGAAVWSSAYLPVNALLRGLAGRIGIESLVSPLLAAGSVAFVYGVGRRLWPDRPSTALTASLLLATSSQLLVTAMTPYAMTAHLAFNLVWLWLFLRGDRRGRLGAIAVGFLACGLHQLVFHPLFVAPFILTLWVERRWRTAALYTCAYAAICLFWIEYPALAAHLASAASPAPGAVAPATAGAALGGFGAQAAGLIGAFSPASVGLMAKNLIRFVVWQNPLVAPLVVLGAAGAVQAKGHARSLVLGLVFTLVAMLVLLPYQGHGWGYRYLHGCLGSAALLAALEWSRLTDAAPLPGGTLARPGFAAAACCAVLLIGLPQVWWAHRFVRPYALAEAAIRRSPRDLVLVDDTASWFTADLVRNDPYLRNRPVVMLLGGLDDRQVVALCARRSIALFDAETARRFGIRTGRPSAWDLPALARVDRVRRLSCGSAKLPVLDVSTNAKAP